MNSVTQSLPAAMPADWRDFYALTKPGVMKLVVFTGLCGLLAAPAQLPPVLAFTAVLCIALGAGAAGALNMWYEADIDAKMKRTASRPLPAGRMDRQSALHFGVGLNIVIGGAAGAFPPMIGWAAATGDVTLLPALLFALIFLWTPPHFWALSLFVRTDYANAGVPMLPVVAGARTTRIQILLYTLPMAAAAIAPWPLGLTGAVYGIAAIALNAVFILLAVPVLLNQATDSKQMGPEKRLFAWSVLYLFAIFAALVADKWIGA